MDIKISINQLNLCACKSEYVSYRSVTIRSLWIPLTNTNYFNTHFNLTKAWDKQSWEEYQQVKRNTYGATYIIGHNHFIYHWRRNTYVYVHPISLNTFTSNYSQQIDSQINPTGCFFKSTEINEVLWFYMWFDLQHLFLFWNYWDPQLNNSWYTHGAYSAPDNKLKSCTSHIYLTFVWFTFRLV